jgi:hypothetical protein
VNSKQHCFATGIDSTKEISANRDDTNIIHGVEFESMTRNRGKDEPIIAKVDVATDLTIPKRLFVGIIHVIRMLFGKMMIVR